MELFVNLTIFIFGASIGSFLNVLIDRLPNDESINGRSHCDFCGKKIAWHDMFPVISFFVLKGKTRCCGKKLS
ncbi:prepilin peptidase, partial [Candidatus Roizmanbacteria bacterium CG_4_10_14_0_2_um_filter_39_12]